MKILLVGDVHWSEYSSIVRKNGEKHSVRLENLIKSIEWVASVEKKEKTDKTIQLGDFFDKSFVNGKEGAALKDADEYTDKTMHKWMCLLGNHEICGSKDSLTLLPCESVVREPQMIEMDGVCIVALPYIFEKNRKAINEYIQELGCDEGRKIIVLSHNDIADVQYGAYKSTTGFPINDIINSVDLFINAHIHNSEWVTKNVLNVGNLTGQNFNEDGLKYKHGVWVLDTEKVKKSSNPQEWIVFYENPYAMKFLNVEITDEGEMDMLRAFVESEPNQWVLAVKTNDEYKDDVQKVINDFCVAGKKIIAGDKIVEEDHTLISVVDHIQKFRKGVIEKFGSTESVMEVLDEIQ